MRSILARFATLAGLLIAPPAGAEWREASTDHFIVYAESSERWLREFADGLERSAAALDKLQPPSAERALSKANRVVIYAVNGLPAVQRLCGKCGSVAGFYAPRVGHSVAYTARTPTSSEWDMSSNIVLFHEYAHHFLLSSLTAAVPRWYNEGFAEFFSTIRVMRDGSVDIGRPAKHRAYNVLNADMKIEQLIDSTGGRSDISQDIFYGRAWLLTHMLMFDPDRRGQLARYLKALNEGTPNLEAAQAAFGDLKLLARQMNGYVQKPMRNVRMPPEMVKVGPVTVRTLTPGEDAMMPVRLRSDRGVDDAEAKAVVIEARRRAAPYPNDAGVQVILAEAEYDAGNDAAADAAADRALAADPKNIEALMYKGRVAVRRAAATRSKDPAVWSAARGWLVRANRGDPDAAEPLMLYFQSFAAARQPPTKNAALGLYRAFDLSPQDPELRVLTALQYLLDDNVGKARTVLLPLAYNPHVPPERNRFTKVVAAIDAKKPVAEILKLGFDAKPADDDAETN